MRLFVLLYRVTVISALTATDLSAAYNDVIVGNAILLGTTDEDFIGLTERAAQNIMKKWELGVC